MRHLIDPLDLTQQEITQLLDIADRICADPAAYQEVANHKKLATLFYEPSTRTRLSFEAAMLNLGGHVLGFPSENVSSATKGESVADTIRVVSCYADIVAMRHPKEGAPLRASRYSRIPVINAGDGGHQHPTQTLTDLMTIRRRMGRLDDLNQLSRYICEYRPKPEEIQKGLEKIRDKQGYSFKTQILIYAVISGSFSVFFGGDVNDMIASALIGIALKLFEAFVKKGALNSLLTVLLCCGAGGVLSNLTVLIGLGHHADLISIGNIMLLIPGIAFTNSLRDMFSGDTITGLIRCMEALLLALVVGLGFTVANLLF